MPFSFKVEIQKNKTKEKNIVYNKFMCQIIIPTNLDIICFLNFFFKPNFTPNNQQPPPYGNYVDR